MFRRIIAGSAGACAAFATVPVAFADDQSKKIYRSIYDDSSEEKYPLPGTIEKPQHVNNAIAKVEGKVDEALQPKAVNVGGYSLYYNESLVSYVKQARLLVSDAADKTADFLRTTEDKLFRGERSVTKTMSSLHDNHEDLLPNSIYVLVAFLSGSVVTRRRNILLRTIVPIAFGTAAFAYLLPRTFENTTGFIHDYEKENVPQLAEAQSAAAARLQQARQETVKAVEQSESTLQRSVHSARQTLKDWTGIDLSGKANK